MTHKLVEEVVLSWWPGSLHPIPTPLFLATPSECWGLENEDFIPQPLLRSHLALCAPGQHGSVWPFHSRSRGAQVITGRVRGHQFCH